MTNNILANVIIYKPYVAIYTIEINNYDSRCVVIIIYTSSPE